MRNILVLTALAAVSMTQSQARFTEDQKEKFFDFMSAVPDGRDFLSQITNNIMEAVNPMLRFSHAVKDAPKEIKTQSSFLECYSCKAGVYALDTQIRGKLITKALE